MRIFSTGLFFTLALSLITVMAEEADQGVPGMGPPEEIKLLEGMIGSWTYKGEVSWDVASPDWEASDAEVEYTYVCGGAAVQMTWAGPMMGRMMHGLSLVCYDQVTKQFTQVWMDDLMGRMSHYTGGFEGDKFVMTGEEIDPTGKKMFSRATTYDITESGHKWTMEISIDKESWAPMMRGEFFRK